MAACGFVRLWFPWITPRSVVRFWIFNTFPQVCFGPLAFQWKRCVGKFPFFISNLIAFLLSWSISLYIYLFLNQDNVIWVAPFVFFFKLLSCALLTRYIKTTRVMISPSKLYIHADNSKLCFNFQFANKHTVTSVKSLIFFWIIRITIDANLDIHLL